MSKVSDLQEQMIFLGKRLSRLREAKTALSKVSTAVPYHLISYDSIFSNYGLKGDKYEIQTEAEEAIVLSVQTAFKTAKSEMLADLEAESSRVFMHYTDTYHALELALTDGKDD